MMRERARRFRGHLAVNIFEGDRLVDRFVGDNLIVNGGYNAIVQALSGVANKAIAKVGIGTSGTVPAIADAALTAVVRVNPTAVVVTGTGIVQVTFTIPLGTAVGMAVREFGLYTTDLTLIARRVRAAAINLQDNTRLDGVWTLTF